MSVKPPLASRADLLRGLSYSTGLPLPAIAPLVSYLPEPEQDSSAHHGTASSTTVSMPDSSKSNSSENHPPEKPIPEQTFYYLSARQSFPTDTVDEGDEAENIPASLRGIAPFQPGELAVSIDDDDVPRPLALLPLAPETRLLPFLRRTLSQPGARRLDVPRLVRTVSQLQPLHRIPWRKRQMPAGRVCILLDLNRRVLPFWKDYQDLCALVSRKHGGLGLEVRRLEDNPGAHFSDWLDPDKPPQAWRMPESNTVVIVLSDLGLLASAGSPVRRQWIHFGQAMRHRGLSAIALIPACSYSQASERQQQDRVLRRYFSCIIWDRNSRFVKQSLVPSDTLRTQKRDRLLALTAPALHVEPELLRAIAYLLPVEETDSGLEAEVWLHPHVRWGYTAFSLHPLKRQHYQKLFRQEEDVTLQKQVLRLIKQHHAGQFPTIWADEFVQAAGLVDFPLHDIDDIEPAELLLRRFTRTYFDHQAHTGMRQYAQRLLARWSTDLKRDKAYPSLLFAMANRHALRDGAVIPDEYDVNRVQFVIGEPVEPREYTVIQQGASLYLSSAGSIFSQDLQTGSPLASLKIFRDVLCITVNGQTESRLVRMDQAFCKLPESSVLLELDSGYEKLIFTNISKPAWADMIGRNQQGLFATLSWVGQPQQLYWQNPTESEPGRWMGGESMGFDDYGLYADLTVKNITQRFRWIEPGTFLMGSPESEAEREPWDEGSETQHSVTLTQGYWLADTACTQALWQAVMRNNPARFDDDMNNPVEQVSWDDIQSFIENLNDLMPGLLACLPTEAQWEYACRAGTRTPFSFGENITPEQVNYDGGHPYAGGEKGQDRSKTVPVKSLPVNPWGLYEMHGNVWEWCQDGYGHYPAEAVTDPVGSQKIPHRVLRGGSWFGDGGGVRSADRFRSRPDERDYDVGFRLALGNSRHKTGTSKQGLASAAAADWRSRSGASLRLGRERAADKGLRLVR